MERLRTAAGHLAAGVARQVASLPLPEVHPLADRHDGQRGQGLAEYALILAFIAIVVIAALSFFGEQLLAVLSGQVGSQIGWVVDNMP